MTDCKSTYGTIQQLYEDYGGYVRTAAGVAAAVISQNPAAAAAAVKAAGKVEDAIKHAHGFWNAKIAKNGPLTFGPRYMDPGEKYTGTIPGPGQRQYISATVMHSDKGQLQIWERDGKGKTDISICLVDALGGHQQLHSSSVNDNKTEQKNEHQVVDVSFSGALGKFVVALFDGDSLTNKFEYSLLLSER